jgi:hypothetical protein
MLPYIFPDERVKTHSIVRPANNNQQQTYHVVKTHNFMYIHANKKVIFFINKVQLASKIWSSHGGDNSYCLLVT